MTEDSIAQSAASFYRDGGRKLDAVLVRSQGSLASRAKREMVDGYPRTADDYSSEKGVACGSGKLRFENGSIAKTFLKEKDPEQPAGQKNAKEGKMLMVGERGQQASFAHLAAGLGGKAQLFEIEKTPFLIFVHQIVEKNVGPLGVKKNLSLSGQQGFASI